MSRVFMVSQNRGENFLKADTGRKKGQAREGRDVRITEEGGAYFLGRRYEV